MGLLIVPQSLARLHHRKDLSYRPISDAPTCPVALAFPDGEQTPLVEEFIGIVRGRKEESSRQPSVLERRQEEAKLRLKKRQSSETTKPAARGQKSSSQRSRTSGGAGSGRRPSKGRGKR